jgi:hypothetical protein
MPYGPPPAILTETAPAVKISAMTAAAALTGAELVPLVQTGLNVRSTTAAIAGLASVAAILVESGAASKVSALPAAGALTGTEQVPVNQGGTTVRTTTLAIAALATPAAPANSLQFNNAGVFGGSANATFVSPLTTLHTATVSTGDLTVTPGNITTGAATNMNLKTSGGTQFRITHNASAVNFWSAVGAATATGFGPYLYADGSDANLTPVIYYKGSTGKLLFASTVNAQVSFKAGQGTSGSDDAFMGTGIGLGNAGLITDGGSSTINGNITLKGGGLMYFWKNTPQVGQPLFLINNPSGTIANYLQVSSATTGGAVDLLARGSDANRNITITSFGTGSSRIELFEGGSTFALVRANTFTSLNTRLDIAQVSNNIELSVAVQGGLSNQNLVLKGAGTGGVIINPASGTTLTQDSTVATTVNLYATPTTLNIGAAATTMAIGKAAAGTLTLNPDTVVGSQTTQNLWNTVATTINFGGAATTLTIGNAGAASTVKFGTGIAPGKLAGAGTQTSRLFAGTGVPNNADGTDNDYYFRADGTVAGNTVMYHKEAGAWVAFTTT